MYTKIPEKKQSPRIPVFDQNKDLPSVLHQIVQDMKENSEKELYNKWGFPWKKVANFKIKMRGNDGLELLFFKLEGGFRVPQEDRNILQRKALETKKDLEKFEKALKKEFKERTGKTLRLSKGKVDCNYELVAYNGLYRFFTIKQCDVKTELDGHTYGEDE